MSTAVVEPGFRGLVGRVKAAGSQLWNGISDKPAKALTLVSNWLQGYRWSFDYSYESAVVHGFRANAVVYAVLTTLAQAIAEPPFVVYDESGADPVPLDKKHPLMQLIASPNPLLTQYDMWELIPITLSIHGHSWWFIESDYTGQPKYLWPLRGDRVAPIYSSATTGDNRPLAGWSYHVPAQATTFLLARDDVLHVRYPDPGGETGGIVEGIGPMQVLRNEIAADNEATRFVAALLGNAAVATTVISVKGPLNRESDYQDIKDGWMAQHGGRNMGQPAVVDADAVVTQLGFSLRDLEFPDLRAVAESRIAAAVGVPPVIAGLKVGLDSSADRDVKQMREIFTEGTCSALWRRMADAFNKAVVARFGEDLRGDFDMTKVKAYAAARQDEIAPIAEAYKNGGVTRNVYLKALGQPPDPINGDVYSVPNTMTVSPDGHSTAPLAPVAPGTDSALPEVKKPLQLPSGKSTPRALLLPAPSPTRAAASPHDEDVDALTADLTIDLARFQRAATTAILNGEPFDEEAFTTTLEMTIHPHLASAMAAEWQRASADVGVQYDAAKVATDALVWADDYVPDLVLGLLDTTRGVLDRVRANKESHPDLTRSDVADALDPAFSDYRAGLVSADGITRAFGVGVRQYQLQLARDSVLTVRVWNSTEDERTCPICAPLDGKRESEWGNVTGPGAHVGCRCAVTLETID